MYVSIGLNINVTINISNNTYKIAIVYQIRLYNTSQIPHKSPIHNTSQTLTNPSFQAFLQMIVVVYCSYLYHPSIISLHIDKLL